MPIKQTALAKHWGLTKVRVGQLVKQGCPLNSIRAADLWRKSRGQKRAPTNKTIAANLQQRGKRGRPKNPRKPSRTGDSLLDALNNAIAIADDAFADYQDARVTDNKLERRSLLAEHSKALEVRMTTEKAYREEQERRNILVPRQEIIEVCRRALDQVLRALRKLPLETGPQCNPTDALLAKTILEREVNKIISIGRRALTEF